MKKFQSRLSKALPSVVVAVVLLGGLFGLQTYMAKKYATREFAENFQVLGKTVQVVVKGTQGPTVVFEPGLNESYTTFSMIQDDISKTVRSFVYDRMALNRTRNKGADGQTGRSVMTQVQDLHQLLAETKVKGPYILVAHSIGGFNARVFAATYPKEVVGVILIDCSYESQPWEEDRISKYGELNYEECIESAAIVRKLNRLDALREKLLTVLTADYKDRGFDYIDYWLSTQKSQAHLSNKSEHIIVEDSGHMIQTEHQEVVEAAILKMVEEARRTGSF